MCLCSPPIQPIFHIAFKVLNKTKAFTNLIISFLMFFSNTLLLMRLICNLLQFIFSDSFVTTLLILNFCCILGYTLLNTYLAFRIPCYYYTVPLECSCCASLSYLSAHFLYSILRAWGYCLILKRPISSCLLHVFALNVTPSFSFCSFSHFLLVALSLQIKKQAKSAIHLLNHSSRCEIEISLLSLLPYPIFPLLHWWLPPP